MSRINFTTATLPARKRIALIAHDHCKEHLLGWADRQRSRLERHELIATGTTGMLLSQRLGLPVECTISGPLGGDQQIGARIVDGRIDVVIFFSDPLTAQPHDPDVKALLRIAQVYDIPIANNRATADFIIKSPLMDKPYTRMLLNFRQEVEKRADSL